MLNYIVFGVGVVIILLFITASLGFVPVMILLNKLGINCFVSDIKRNYKMIRNISKDAVAWLSIPGVCTAPVMQSDNAEYYKSHDIKKRPNKYGELYIDTRLQALGIANTDVIGDLTIIKSTGLRAGANLRTNGFTLLRKTTELYNVGAEIELCDSINRVRKFRFLAMIDTDIAGVTSLAFTTRDELIKSFVALQENDIKFHTNPYLRKTLTLASYVQNLNDGKLTAELAKIQGAINKPNSSIIQDATSDKVKSIIFLQCQTNIDNVMVMLGEE